MEPPRPPMTPREGDTVGVGVRVGAAETMTDCLPASAPSRLQITITVCVPGLTLDHRADWLALVPDRSAWRPWAKVDWPLVSREALPKPLLLLVQALVVTDTVDP